MGDIPVLGIHEIAFEVRDLERSFALAKSFAFLSIYPP
jgi:hypothetical protein